MVADGLLTYATTQTTFGTSESPGPNFGAWETARKWGDGRSLYLWGPSGVGKSHLARCLIMRGLWEGVTVAEVTAATFTAARYDEVRNLFPALVSARLLLLDDLDKGAWNERALSSLWELLDRRSTARYRRIIVTSNLEPGALAKAWTKAAAANESTAQGITDRLLPMTVLGLTGPSWRGREAG